MFTWNFQYISKSRLAEAFSQLMLDPKAGDILIRIHTPIHREEEAVDLARFIKTLAPEAHIFGTSTSAVITWGRISGNQCIISVTQMSEGSIRSAMLPTFDSETGLPIDPGTLCRNVRDAVIGSETKLLLTFLPVRYLDVFRFIELTNDCFPGVQIIGGLANTSELNLHKFSDHGFVFNENGWSDSDILLASFSGSSFESLCSLATGAQAIGKEVEVTDTFGTCILSLDDRDAAAEYRIGVGDALKTRPELTNLFPYVYSDASEIPFLVRFSDDVSLAQEFPDSDPAFRHFYDAHPALDCDAVADRIYVNHFVEVGRKLRRAFIYDRKIITDNQAMFRRVENFEKAETIFGYSCSARAMLYSNCVKWELSAYENSNICGCVTDGEIVYTNGRNHFANCSFVVSVMGEAPAQQNYNPFAFSHTDTLAADNRELLDYLYDAERKLTESNHEYAADSLKAFVRDCEMKLLYSEQEDIPNAARLNMDIRLKGYDRICMINVFETTSMETVFSEHMIDLTYRNYISTVTRYAKEKHYDCYLVSKWHLAVAAPSYLVSLSEFVGDMDTLQHELFESAEEYIAIVPMFCVIDDFTADNLNTVYYSARMEMMQKNIQFYVRDAKLGQLDEESIRERYHMVNVINYAIAHDKVIPYFQGIHDNKRQTIHHYESLMRIEDENGTVYSPASFLEVSRSYGLLYDTMSEIMIRKVLEKFRNIPDISVSINLGIRDIKKRDLIDYICGCLATSPHPENFVFEILENEDIDDYDELITFVDRIHDLGGQISIDDFGSGFSNLQHIAYIHSDYLKIDGSIIKKCCEDEESESLIALISGWKRLSSRPIRIIAEYVENEAIQQKLLAYDIDFSQGYLFSKPKPDILHAKDVSTC